MQTIQSNEERHAHQAPFNPSLASTFRIETKGGFTSTSVCYSPKHNMIIACPADHTMRFYDATTLLPLKERETKELADRAMQMSFHPETDTYLIGCTGGSLYMYNASSNELKKLDQCRGQVLAAIFLNPVYYAYSALGSSQLVLRDVGNEDLAMRFAPSKYDIICLENLGEQKFLLAGFFNGLLMIYRTDRLPRLQAYGSIRVLPVGKFLYNIQRITINRKEYVITTGEGNPAMKIWHLIKGRMRLLKVVKTGISPFSVIYLEDYKMIAVVCELDFVQFVRLPSGKLENKVYLEEEEEEDHNLFVMEEKNMIGVTSGNNSSIEIFKLSDS